MENMRVAIIGYGVVGHNLYQELRKGNIDVDIIDKYKPEVNKRRYHHYDIAFVCVDTPRRGESAVCDVSEVYNAIGANSADLFVIKSTVLPGTTEQIGIHTGKNVIFSPEYYGGTQHCNNFHFGFTICGGDRAGCKKLIQLLQNVYDARHQFRITDSRTAELVKYMENSYLATKVSFCNQFFEIAEQVGVDYEELRELFVLDERVDPSHTFVYRDHPFWQSHCLDKDVPAIAEVYDAPFLKNVIAYNELLKAEHESKEVRERIKSLGNELVNGFHKGIEEPEKECGCGGCGMCGELL